jgi:hypothetical protein
MKSGVLLVLIAALCGCGEKTPESPTGKPPVHEHHAPHGGALEVLGEEAAHVELVLDGKTGKLTAYVLDGEAENPVRVAQDVLRLTITGPPGGDAVVELSAVANALTGEKVGDTSQFEGTSEMLRGLTKFEAVLTTITARGVKFDAVPIGFPGGNEHEEKTDVGK